MPLEIAFDGSKRARLVRKDGGSERTGRIYSADVGPGDVLVVGWS